MDGSTGSTQQLIRRQLARAKAAQTLGDARAAVSQSSQSAQPHQPSWSSICTSMTMMSRPPPLPILSRTVWLPAQGLRGHVVTRHLWYHERACYIFPLLHNHSAFYNNEYISMAHLFQLPRFVPLPVGPTTSQQESETAVVDELRAELQAESNLESAHTEVVSALQDELASALKTSDKLTVANSELVAELQEARALIGASGTLDVHLKCEEIRCRLSSQELGQAGLDLQDSLRVGQEAAAAVRHCEHFASERLEATLNIHNEEDAFLRSQVSNRDLEIASQEETVRLQSNLEEMLYGSLDEHQGELREARTELSAINHLSSV